MQDTLITVKVLEHNVSHAITLKQEQKGGREKERKTGK